MPYRTKALPAGRKFRSLYAKIHERINTFKQFYNPRNNSSNKLPDISIYQPYPMIFVFFFIIFSIPVIEFTLYCKEFLLAYLCEKHVFS